jgi:hypothetical protein
MCQVPGFKFIWRIDYAKSITSIAQDQTREEKEAEYDQRAAPKACVNRSLVQ